MTLPEVDDLKVDRFYHCILSSDRNLCGLLDELSLSSKLHFVTTGMAFFGKDGGLHQMSTPLQFLTFPLVSRRARLRLAASIAGSGLVRDSMPLESESVESWLRRTAGNENFEVLWGPLLASKFDDDFSRLPASYMWARLRRMMSTRDKTTGAEQMGHLEGGYQTLIDGLTTHIKAQGGTIHTRTRAVGIRTDAQGRANGVEVEANGTREMLEADTVVLTVSNRLIKGLLGPDLPPETQRPLDSIGYLAIVCPLLVLDRPLSPFYTINIVDRSLSLTGVIETTNIINPAFLGGRHLVYLPKYCTQTSPELQRSDEAILEDYVGQLAKVLPAFQRKWILASRVMRAKETEPFHPMAPSRELVPYSPGPPGIFVANSTQVYPDLVNCEAMAANVRRALDAIHEGLGSKPGATSLSAPLS